MWSALSVACVDLLHRVGRSEATIERFALVTELRHVIEHADLYQRGTGVQARRARLEARAVA